MNINDRSGAEEMKDGIGQEKLKDRNGAEKMKDRIARDKLKDINGAEKLKHETGRDKLKEMIGKGLLKGVIFDLDGTLIHSNVAFTPYRERLAMEGDIIAGIEELPIEEQKEKWEIIHEYEQRLEEKARPAPGVHTLLEYLKKKGLHIGVITRSTGTHAKKLIHNHNLKVDLSLGREDIKPKPHPDGLHFMLDQFGIGPHNAIMVGDFLWDILAGKNAGMLTVLVVQEHSLPFAEEADVVVDSLTELLTIFQSA